MPERSRRRFTNPSAIDIAVIGLLVAVGVVIVLLMSQSPSRAPAASASAAARIAATTNPHTATSGTDVWAIGVTDRALKLDRSSAGGQRTVMVTVELGDAVNGTVGQALRCPGASGDQWILFGKIAPPARIGMAPGETPSWTQTREPLASYIGPPATGGLARDGLYLFALDQATFDPTLEIKIVAPNGSATGYSPGALVPIPQEQKQPSGCFLR